jgi:hypothetical protein
VFHRSPAARAVAPAIQRQTGGREVFRLVPPVVLWWVWVAFAVANVADFVIQSASSARFATTVSAILATVTGLAYALALRPRVLADQDGLTIVNPFRDYHVPWAAIQTVDTGDWVQVHYLPDGDAPAAPDGDAPAVPSSAAAKVISCWALYVSARAKRKAARPPRRRGNWLRPYLPDGFGGETGYAGSSRLPEEAKYLASLPVAKAIAVRLDTRAGQERARGERVGRVTARWSWPRLAAVTVPALALLIIALA